LGQVKGAAKAKNIRFCWSTSTTASTIKSIAPKSFSALI
jgi:hypothetical protein